MLRSVQPLLAFAAAHLDEDVSLASLAARAGLSAFHLHRVFSATAGETPKQYTLRLRLGRAAAMLLTGNDSVLNVALACGFQSHEAFSRAFRRRFGMTPRDYRARGFAPGPEQTEEHERLVNRVGPCVGLFRMSENRRSQRSDMAYSIEKKELSPQPVLVVRRRVKPTEIAATLAEVLQQVFLLRATDRHCSGWATVHALSRLGAGAADNRGRNARGRRAARHLGRGWNPRRRIAGRARGGNHTCRPLRQAPRSSRRRPCVDRSPRAWPQQGRPGSAMSPIRRIIPIPRIGRRRSFGRLHVSAGSSAAPQPTP